MDEPVRHREILPSDIEQARRATPADRMRLAGELTDLALALERAGARRRAALEQVD